MREQPLKKGAASVGIAHRGCERRQSRPCRGEEEGAEAFFLRE